MKTKTLIAIAVAVVVGLTAVWYFASPAYAMSQLRDAAMEGDADELEEHIDFPAVRESVKGQMQAMMMAEMQKQAEDNPFGAMGGMFAMGIVGTVVDNMVTPSGMAAMIKQGKMQRDPAEADRPSEPIEWEIERDGFDRFYARPVGRDTKAGLKFERDGLGWKLTGLEMPAEGETASEPAS